MNSAENHLMDLHDKMADAIKAYTEAVTDAVVKGDIPAGSDLGVYEGTDEEDRLYIFAPYRSPGSIGEIDDETYGAMFGFRIYH